MSFAVFEVDGKKRKQVSGIYTIPGPARDLLKRLKAERGKDAKPLIIRQKILAEGDKRAKWRDFR